MSLTFEWDENRSEKNEKNHGITFEEAKTVFNDPFAITVDDPDVKVHFSDSESVNKALRSLIAYHFIKVVESFTEV